MKRELVMRKLLIVLSLSQFDYHSLEDTSEKWVSPAHYVTIFLVCPASDGI